MIAASSVHDVTSLEVNGRSKGLPMMPVQHDYVREEKVKSTRHNWLKAHSSTANIVTPTVIEDFKRLVLAICIKLISLGFGGLTYRFFFTL